MGPPGAGSPPPHQPGAHGGLSGRPKPLRGSLLLVGAGPGETPSAGFRVWPGSVPVIASPGDLVSPLQEAAWETADMLIWTPAPLQPGPRGEGRAVGAEQAFSPLYPSRAGWDCPLPVAMSWSSRAPPDPALLRNSARKVLLFGILSRTCIQPARPASHTSPGSEQWPDSPGVPTPGSGLPFSGGGSCVSTIPLDLAGLPTGPRLPGPAFRGHQVSLAGLASPSRIAAAWVGGQWPGWAVPR